MNCAKGYLVHLTPEEIEAATQEGRARHANARAQGFQHNAGFEPKGATEDVNGRAAEIAVAKLLGVFPGVFDLQQDSANRHDGDVAHHEVRHTHLEHGRLIIRPRDPDDRVYVLVVGTMPDLRIVGWIRGAEAKQQSWWMAPNERPGAYFVPQDALHDIADLIELHLKRAAIAAETIPMLAEEGKKRQLAAGSANLRHESGPMDPDSEAG
jgi:hypothetical protein